MEQKRYGRFYRRRIRRDAATLRRACGKAAKQTERSPAQEWLRDNGYLFRSLAQDLRASTRALPFLPRGKGQARLGQKCASLCADAEEWTHERLLDALRQEGLTSAEAQALPFMLRESLLHEAAAHTDDAQTLKRTIERLRGLPDLRISDLQETLSPLEALLRQDPAGVYADMDEESRAMYRARIFARACSTGQNPDDLARHALKQAQSGSDTRTRHVGAYILPAPHRGRGVFFLCLESLTPLLASVGAGLLLRSVRLSFLLVLPLWAILSPFWIRLSQRGVAAVRMPRMDLPAAGEAQRTLLTVSALLPPAAKTSSLRAHLTQLYLSNGQSNIKVCLLADLRTAGTPVRPEDKADIAAAARLIQELNTEYGGGFLLAVRPRVYAPTEGCYTGWERKRGAITQLVRYIRTGENAFAHLSGDTAQLRKTQYLLALDADTSLPMDAAMEMLRAAAHPLQQPVIRGGRVRSGYGVLAPLVRTRVDESMTRFRRIFSPDSGLSAYDNVIGERYQDLFGESVFAGKGLIHVGAFYETLDHALPEGRVLSHDSVEGGFLRCGFLSDVQIADGFPRTEQVWLDRMERCVRGDWQNLRFVFAKSPLSFLTRFQIFDNVRRDATPCIALLGLVLCVFLPRPTAAAVLAACLLSVSGAELCGAVRTLLTEGTSAFSRMYYSGAVPTALGQMLRGVLQIVMLPLQALIGASAACKAVFRSVCSRRRLLEWTTFAQSQSASSRRRTLAQCFVQAAFAGAMFVSGRAEMKLLAVLFLINIPLLLAADRRHTAPPSQPDERQREKLRSYAAAMWDYFSDNCDFRNNYLPPDNVQETPVYRVAQRTSPTNIGIAMLCVLAARDMGFIDSREMCARLGRTLASVEQLETYKGNLLNWYDTRTLRPLLPKYVSTVDCGNFLCCLTALLEGIAEYRQEAPELDDAAKRIRALLDSADLSCMYDARRHLFHIGLDPVNGRRSGSYYDMLMSEARMTGYYAVGRRIVPKKHWAALSRTASKVGRRCGLLSWTGTMFEYFMPYLFLPAPAGTLGYEALRFCAWSQKKRVRSGEPFGISESGFYAFDRELNYQYKAHGVQALGLRQDLDKETVIAPYASFLLMQMQPRAALRNLEKLEKMQMTGRWGFYEALDCTPERTDGKRCAVVRSYMAHHVGMSLLSVLNVLEDGILRRRFMRAREMRAAQSLLEEGVPIHARPFKNKHTRETTAVREKTEQAKREIRDPSFLAPNCRVLSNGEASVCCADTGASQAVYRGVSLFTHSRDLLHGAGPVVVLQGAETSLPFADMVGGESGAAFRCVLGGTDVRYSAKKDDLLLRVRVRVHPTLAALEYTMTVRSALRQSFDGSLLFYAEPSLAPHKQASAHPAFSKLFIEDMFDEAHRAVLFRRRERDGSSGVCMAAGFLHRTSFTCTRARAAALKTGYGLSSLTHGGVHFADLPGGGDCCLALEIPVHLTAHGTEEWKLLLTAASTTQEALDKLLLIRREGMHKGAGGLFREGRMEAALADKLLPGTVFGARDTHSRRALCRNPFPLHHIWRFGVSGELPIVYRRVDSAEDVPTLFPYMRAVHRLCRAGFPCDLLIGYAEGGTYDTPLLRGIRAQIREACGDESGAPEIVPIDLTHFTDADEAFLRAVSILTLDQGEKEAAFGQRISLQDAAPTIHSEKLYSFTENLFTIPKDAKSPYLPWSLVLCNPSFGTLVTDKSLGFTWAINAHEMQITPWRGDIAAENDAECLILCANGKRYDLIRRASAVFSPDYARWEGAVGDISYSVRMTVPDRALCKRCRVEIRSEHGREISLVYGILPVLGGSGDLVRAERFADGVHISSPDSPVGGHVMLTVAGGADAVYTDRAAFVCGGSAPDRPWAGVEKRLTLTQTVQTAEFSLSFGVRQSAAAAMPSLSAQPSPMRGSIRMHSSDSTLDALVNTWLPWQVRKCRFEGRTGFYQCGGAWGFRDQLQDVSSFLYTDPQTVKRHLLRCAAVQFTEGDVLHWWHRLSGEAGGLRGVRTRYRDDLLWLPWLTAQYVAVTGDCNILEIPVPYLRAEPLGQQETERYFSPERDTLREPLLRHCLRAVDCALQKGAHGLVLIGGGDWNDGFDRVGAQGRGESVWLTMFLIHVLDRMLPLADAQTRARYLGEIAAMRQAIESSAWDGDHYLRAFLDDGTPLGKTGDAECAIDSLPQSFAIDAGLDPQRVRMALRTAKARLVDTQRGIIKLLDPPFTGEGRQAGYITAYPPGVRENGGQYTHAAVWLCGALLRAGQIREGMELLRMLHPAFFCADEAQADRYGGEPYALAGDIPANERRIACTGWTLYTGSAAWYYRLILETVLGVRIENKVLRFDPHLELSMLPVSLHINVFFTELEIRIERGNEKKLCVNGNKQDTVPLDGEKKNVLLQLNHTD